MRIQEFITAIVNDPRQSLRLKKARSVLTEHPCAVVIFCSDEKTGQRFGRTQRRIKQCKKLGHTTYRYQIWASWSKKDIQGY